MEEEVRKRIMALARPGWVGVGGWARLCPPFTFGALESVGRCVRLRRCLPRPYGVVSLSTKKKIAHNFMSTQTQVVLILGQKCKKNYYQYIWLYINV